MGSVSTLVPAESRGGDDVTVATVHGRVSSRPKGRADSAPL